ncbi:MAG: sulfotransferase family protein [Myxococcota bacterium]
MLFHFDFGNWGRMIRLAWGERNPRARRTYLAVLLLWVPLVACFHAVCFFLDPLLFPSLRRTRVKAPVFVIGHARSGTTLVHRLMSRDAGRFSAFMLYELYFPSLLQKKLIRAAARADARWLGGALERRVRAWEEKRYGGMRGVHEMGLTQYEEDDIVFYYSCASGFWITKMPYMGDLDFYSVDRWPARRRRRLMRFYRDCVRRQLALNGPDKIHLSKNPVFAGRVETLIEAFPDARIVVPLRNPYETIPSLLKLMRLSWKRLRWDEERQRRCLRVLAEQSFETYLHPLEVLERHPETRHAIVDYRDAVADPAATIEQVYRALDLPMTPAYRELLLAEGKRARSHRSSHAYSLAEFGLEADAIRTRLAPLFERHGWDVDTDAEGGA